MPESDNLDSIADNLTETSAWIRIIFMIAFCVVLYFVLAPIILVLMLAQAVFTVITGDANRNLRFFGSALTKYVSQILEFISYNSELEPFPFSDFPNVEEDEEGSVARTVEKPAVKKATRKAKPAGRKKVAKKKPKTTLKKTTGN